MEPVALFQQQVLADRLEGMDDLRETVIVVGGLDKDRIEFPFRFRIDQIRGLLEQHGKLHSGKEASLCPDHQCRYAGRVFLDEDVVYIFLLPVIAAVGNVNI